jgi:hypothetical protein
VLKKLERNKKQLNNTFLQRKRNNPEITKQDVKITNIQNTIKKVFNNKNTELKIENQKNEKQEIKKQRKPKLTENSLFSLELLNQNNRPQILENSPLINLNAIPINNPNYNTNNTLNNINATLSTISHNKTKSRNSYTNVENEYNFEAMIKDYLNVADFPNEMKEKVALFKKITSLYKKIKEESKKTGADPKKFISFLEILSSNIKEPVEEIKVK